MDKKISEMSKEELQNLVDGVIDEYKKNQKPRRWSDLNETEKNELINKEVERRVKVYFNNFYLRGKR